MNAHIHRHGRIIHLCSSLPPLLLELNKGIHLTHDTGNTMRLDRVTVLFNLPLDTKRIDKVKELERKGFELMRFVRRIVCDKVNARLFLEELKGLVNVFDYKGKVLDATDILRLGHVIGEILGTLRWYRKY